MNQLFADELKVSWELWKNPKSARWESPLERVEIGQYLAISLTTPRKVKSEGYLMQNCVRDYVDRCQDGEYLIFSIRNLDGERVATLGAINRDDRWYFDECLGKENSNVIETTETVEINNNFVHEIEYTELFSVAHEVVRLLNSQAVDSEEV